MSELLVGRGREYSGSPTTTLWEPLARVAAGVVAERLSLRMRPKT
jgi:hypothetical protein